MPKRTAQLALLCYFLHLFSGCEVPATSPKPPSSAVRPQDARPDVVIFLIDTLRKDHLGCYGYPINTSPNIDAFAQDAVQFRQLIPMSSWTRPSVASLLTGTMDFTHHALSPEDHLAEGLPSLPTTLKAAGWQTHAAVANPEVGANYGFAAGFDTYADLWQGRQKFGWEDDAKVLSRALEHLAPAGDAPLFLYLHLIAPHRNYEPRPGTEEAFVPEQFVGTRREAQVQRERALYDAEIHGADAEFGRLIAALRTAGRYDNALIVLLSDHGEQFMEHGERAHANSLHFEELGVPLLIKLPGNAHRGTRVRETA